MKRNLIIQGAIGLMAFVFLSPLLGFTFTNWSVSMLIAFVCSLIIDKKN